MNRAELLAIIKKHGNITGQNYLIAESFSLGSLEALALEIQKQNAEINGAGHLGAMTISKVGTATVSLIENIIYEVNKFGDKFGIK